MVPLPEASRVSHSKDRQVAHAGRGGCLRVPHAVHRWMRSLCCLAPSKKNRLSWVRAGRGRLAARGRLRCLLAGPEFEDAELHGGDRLAALVGELESVGDEVADTETSVLLPTDRVNHRGHLQQVAGHQRALVVLVTVGCHNRSEAGSVQQGHERVGRCAALRLAAAPSLVPGQRGPQAGHGPGLQHGGRGDHSFEARGPGRLVVEIDRVVVPHRLHPVTNHRLVHRIGSCQGCA